MSYVLLIHQGEAPLPQSEEWELLPDEEKKAVYQDYQAIRETPGVSPGLQLQPAETATTIRVQNGESLINDGPFSGDGRGLAGYLVFEADDLDDAIDLASRIPQARMGGAVEVRRVTTY